MNIEYKMLFSKNSNYTITYGDTMLKVDNQRLTNGRTHTLESTIYLDDKVVFHEEFILDNLDLRYANIIFEMIGSDPHLIVAFSIANMAHKDQVDKGGFPYIYHPIRVALQMYTVPEKMIALLHDVIEDSDITYDDIITKFAVLGEQIELYTMNRTVPFLMKITRNKDENEAYEDYIQRCKSHEIPRFVKIADLMDNLDIDRIPSIDTDTFLRCADYVSYLNELLRDD